MEEYLFKISLMPADACSKYHGQSVKPVYFVARNKDSATKWAKENLKSGLAIRSVSMMGQKLANNVFSGSI